MAPRKKSVVWSFFKAIGEDAVQCLICPVSLVHKGHTTSMLRHLRMKHPVEFASADDGERPEAETTETDDQHTEKDGEQYCSVEVALEDGDGDGIATVNRAEITCAINGLFEAAEGVAVKQRKRKKDGTESQSTRKRSSIWTHYQFLENQRCSLCLLCMKKIQHNGNTSNLHRHLSKKHPNSFSELRGVMEKPANSLQHTTSIEVEGAKPVEAIVVKDKFSDMFEVTRVSEGDLRVWERERELVEALRNAQKQEALALEHQRELLEMLRVANVRETAAERERIDSMRKVQEEEAKELERQREELQKERAELQKQWDQLQSLTREQPAE